MKHHYPIILLSVFLVMFSCKNSEMTAEEVWENYVLSVGDPEQLANIKTYFSKSIGTSEMGEIISESTVVYPDKVNFTFIFEDDTSQQIINGDRGMNVYPDGKEEMSKEQFLDLRETCLVIPELHYVSNGYVFSHEGMGKENNRWCHRIRVQHATWGRNMEYWIDEEDYTLHKMVDEAGTVSYIKEVYFVDGVKLVKRMIMDHPEFTLDFEYIENVFNLEVEESLFDISSN